MKNDGPINHARMIYSITIKDLQVLEKHLYVVFLLRLIERNRFGYEILFDYLCKSICSELLVCFVVFLVFLASIEINISIHKDNIWSTQIAP